MQSSLFPVLPVYARLAHAPATVRCDRPAYTSRPPNAPAVWSASGHTLTQTLYDRQSEYGSRHSHHLNSTNVNWPRSQAAVLNYGRLQTATSVSQLSRTSPIIQDGVTVTMVTQGATRKLSYLFKGRRRQRKQVIFTAR